jgi:phosphatidylglycerophosphatase C
VDTPAPGRRRGDAPGDCRPLVAFDFDGTLTVRDTFTAFLLWRSPVWRKLLAPLRLLPAAMYYLLTRDRGRFKSAAFAALVGAIPATTLTADAERFAETIWERLLRPDALARWNAHGENGDERAIVTASPELVIAPFAHRLEADRLIGTRLEIGRDGSIDGRLMGPNCRGPEKVIRLEAVYGPGVRLAAAYGDTAGDDQMLARADKPFMRLFKGRPLGRRRPRHISM